MGNRDENRDYSRLLRLQSRLPVPFEGPFLTGALCLSWRGRAIFLPFSILNKVPSAPIVLALTGFTAFHDRIRDVLVDLLNERGEAGNGRFMPLSLFLFYPLRFHLSFFSYQYPMQIMIHVPGISVNEFASRIVCKLNWIFHQ